MSRSEAFRVTLFFISTLCICILLGCFIGEIAGAWDSFEFFVEAIRVCSQWSFMVLVSAFVVSIVATLKCLKLGYFSDPVSRPKYVEDLMPIETVDMLPSLLSSTPNYSNFPTHFLVQDVWKNVAKYLDYESLISFTLTSKYFNYQILTKPEINFESISIEILCDQIFVLFKGVLYFTGKNDFYQENASSDSHQYSFLPIKIKGIEEKICIEQFFCCSERKLVLLSNRTLYGYGSNNEGQLGVGDVKSRECFTLIDFKLKENQFIKAIVSEKTYTLMLLSDGTLHYCGKMFGEYYEVQNTFKQFVFNGDQKVTQIVATSEHHLLIRMEDGGLYFIGGNIGQNFGNEKYYRSWVKVNLDCVGKNSRIFVDMGPHYNETFLISSNKQLYGAGENSYGELGILNYMKSGFQQIPFDLKEGTDFKSVTLGSHVCFILLTDGTFYGSGFNLYGQLGLGNKKNQRGFQRIKVNDENTFITRVVSVGDHTFVITKEGDLYATGNNTYGQLGLGDDRDRNLFTKVVIEGALEKTKVREVIANYKTTILIMSDNTMYKCGCDTWDNWKNKANYKFKPFDLTVDFMALSYEKQESNCRLM